MSNKEFLKQLKMRYFPKIFTIFLLFVITFTFSCKRGAGRGKEKKNDTITEDTLFNNPYKTTVLKFKNKTFGIPSPVLLSRITHELNIPFEPSLLNDYQNSTKYLTTFKKAINLGVYSANLAYINIYDQVSMFGNYYQVVKKIAEDLDLLSHIPQSTMDRIEQNSENKDSLVYIVSTLFRDIDAYLSDNDQQELGAIIIAGGWIESIYMLTQLYKRYPSEELLIKIGEQKAPLNNLLQLLQPYYNQQNPEIDYLFESLADISSFYDAISFEYQYSAPQDYPDKHFTVINSKTRVNVDNLDLEQITKRIVKLRNWVIN